MEALIVPKVSITKEDMLEAEWARMTEIIDNSYVLKYRI